MSAKGGSPLTTFLFSIPLAAIPLMAIFGIPQFAPVVASPDDAGADFDDRSPSQHPDYRRRASDLMQPYEDRGLSQPLSDAPAFDGASVDLGHNSDSMESFDRPAGMALNSASDLSARNGSPSSAVDPADRTAPFEAAPGWHEETSGDNAASATPGTSAPTAGKLNWREASRLLSEMGIEDYHLEPGAEEGSFLFVCSLTPAGAANVTMRFEAEAEDPLMAVSDVLGQVDRWLKQRYAQSREIAPLRQ